MDTNNFTFSASSVKDYIQCGLKFKYGRIDKATRSPAATHHKWMGDLVHNAIYASVARLSSFKSWAVMDSPMTTEDLDALFEELWSGTSGLIKTEVQAREKFRFVEKSSPLFNSISTPEDAELVWKKIAKEMITYGVEMLKGLQIVELEKKLVFTILKKNFVGFLDVLAVDPTTGQYIFYDFKTSWDKEPESKLAEDIQFFCYALALKDILKLDYWPTGYWVHLRTGKVVPYVLTPKTFSIAMAKMKKVFSNMENGVFFPAFGSPLCKYCDFRHLCYGSEDYLWQS